MAHKEYNEPFPDEFVNPKEKQAKSYGLQVARGVYSDFHRNGSNYFYGEKEEHDKFRLYAKGEQDIADFKAVVGSEDDSDDSLSTYATAVRFNINNYATNLINIAVAKIHNRQFDPYIRVTSPKAINRRKDLKTKLELIALQKEVLMDLERQSGQAFLAEGENIPRDMDEYELDLEMNTKERSAVRAEKGILHFTEASDWKQKSRKIVDDLVVLGGGISLVKPDAVGLPEMKYINPSLAIFPYAEDEVYTNLKYGGHIEHWTVSDLKKYAGKELDEYQINEICESHGIGRAGNFDSIDGDYRRNYQDVKKIAVLYFEWKTVDVDWYTKKSNKYGNLRLFKSEDKYYNSEKRENYTGKNEFINDSYETIYRGYWIIDSDYVIKWGKKNHIYYKDKYFKKCEIGYSVHKVKTSLVEQMIPVLDDLYEINLKIRQHLASGVPKGLGVDMAAIASATLTLGNQKMSGKELLDLYFQRGILVYNGNDHKYPGSGKPFEQLDNGFSRDLERLFNYNEQKKRELLTIIGSNEAAAASTLSPEMGKAVTQMQIAANDTALDHLFFAMADITEKTYQKINDLDKQSEKYSTTKQYYIETFGTSNYRFIEDLEEFPAHTYSIKVKARPTREDWNRLYMEAEKAVQNGQIGLDDKLALEDFNSLKEAQIYLRIKIKKYKQEAQEAKQADIEATAQVQQQSNAQTAQNKQKELQIQAELELKKLQMQMQVENNQHKNKLEQIEKEIELLTIKENFVNDNKSDNTIDEIIVKAEEERETVIIKEQAKPVKQAS